MGIRSWLKRIRQHEDEAAVERAEAMALETPAEREISTGDIEGMQADIEAGLISGEGLSVDEAKRLAE